MFRILPSTIAIIVALFTFNSTTAQCDQPTTTKLTISTGYNTSTGTLLNDFDLDPMWRLTQAPPDPPNWTSNIGGPAIVIPKQRSWLYAGSQSRYLNAYPTNAALTDNWNLNTVPYIYERVFCLCTDDPQQTTTQVQIQLALNADNWAEVKIEGPNGQLIPLLSQKYRYSVHNFIGKPDTIDTTMLLPIGQYKMKVYHRNQHIAMGVNLDGTISGRGVLPDGYCSELGTVAGFLYDDLDKNGKFNRGDRALVNTKVSLYNDKKVFIKEVLTDHTGYYFFMDLAPGKYHVVTGEAETWNFEPPYPNVKLVTVDVNDITRTAFLFEEGFLQVESALPKGLDIVVYPNPTKGMFQIDLKGAQQEFRSLEILDPVGKTVLSTEEKATLEAIDLSAQHKGIYHVFIQFDSAVITRKITLY